ncbi:hypothetical protein [Methylopila sp. 73B]|uniref:hypothetical protein n=1 Tax=Methylopila sp. 73B TaxID=1120792 RepID=UPI00035C8457|nr:hypothetical protein [Methylopila sp. 73B]
MTEPLRIKSVSATEGSPHLLVTWANDMNPSLVRLSGWIASGGEVLAPLMDRTVFEKPRVAEHGAAVEWGDDGGDLAIDAIHLYGIAYEQQSFTGRDLGAWQERLGLSNVEAAEALGLSRSKYMALRADLNEAVPTTIAIACRAMLNDPTVLQAHYRPTPRSRGPRRAYVGSAFARAATGKPDPAGSYLGSVAKGERG